MQLFLINIANLASGHGTEKSMEYLKSMKKVEEAVRTGDFFLKLQMHLLLPLLIQ